MIVGGKSMRYHFMLPSVLIFASLISLLCPVFAAAECPMVSADGRYLLVQETAEALNFGWMTRRTLYDLKGAASGKLEKPYTADDTTAERPDLDYIQRSLRTILEKHGVDRKCLTPIRPANKKLVAKRSGCGVKVAVDGKSLGTAKFSFGEEAMHGSDPCDGNFELSWYELPGGRYFVEATSVMEDDPAMGSFVLGRGHAVITGRAK